MKHAKFVLLLIGFIALFAAHAAAQTTPEKGSAERKAILDALRANARNIKGLSGKVVFNVSQLQVKDNWAFVMAAPEGANGAELTTFKNSCEFDAVIVALLKKSAKGWRVVARDYCISDVSYEDWDKRFGAPRSIFGFQ